MLAYDGYEQDVNYITEQCRFMLRILGIWPIFQGKVSVATRIQNLFAILTCYILLFCSVIPGSLYYIYGVEPDLQVRLKFLVVHVYACMTVAKYSSLVLHERDIRSCLSHLKEDWRMFGDASYRKLMIHRATTARRFFLFCWAFMYFSNLCYSAFVPLSRGKVVIDENTTIRPLSAPAYYVFFDEQKSPAYEIVFLIQALSSFVTSTITITLCGLTAVFVMHACAQLEILTEILGNCVREETVKKETLNRKLAIVVGHHIRVRNFVHMVEISLQESSLVEIVGCTSIVCLLGYCILLVTIVLLYSNGQCKISDGLRYSELEDKNTAAVLSFIVGAASVSFNIFLLCYIGDQLTTQAERVAWTSCTLEWYRISDRKVRSLVMIIAMSNASMKITAGKFIPLSLKSFGDVLKTSAAYFNMLRTVTD